MVVGSSGKTNLVYRGDSSKSRAPPPQSNEKRTMNDKVKSCFSRIFCCCCCLSSCSLNTEDTDEYPEARKGRMTPSSGTYSWGTSSYKSFSMRAVSSMPRIEEENKRSDRRKISHRRAASWDVSSSRGPNSLQSSGRGSKISLNVLSQAHESKSYRDCKGDSRTSASSTLLPKGVAPNEKPEDKVLLQPYLDEEGGTDSNLTVIINSPDRVFQKLLSGALLLNISVADEKNTGDLGKLQVPESREPSCSEESELTSSQLGGSEAPSQLRKGSLSSISKVNFIEYVCHTFEQEAG